MQHVKLLPTKAQPSVYADWLKAADDAPTVLVYGHYGVHYASLPAFPCHCQAITCTSPSITVVCL